MGPKRDHSGCCQVVCAALKVVLVREIDQIDTILAKAIAAESTLAKVLYR